MCTQPTFHYVYCTRMLHYLNIPCTFKYVYSFPYFIMCTHTMFQCVYSPFVSICFSERLLSVRQFTQCVPKPPFPAYVFPPMDQYFQSPPPPPLFQNVYGPICFGMCTHHPCSIKCTHPQSV